MNILNPFILQSLASLLHTSYFKYLSQQPVNYMTLRPSNRIEQLFSHRKDLDEIWY
jgi:hypothetical protein